MDLECPLLGGSPVRRLRRRAATLPLFWKGHSHLQFSFLVARSWRRRWKAWWEKINSPGLVTRIKLFVIGRRVRRLPAVERAYIHWRRRYQWRFWRLRWLRAVIVFIAILCMVYHRHCCRMLKGLGGRFRSFKFGGTIGSCRPNPYGIVRSLESSLIVKIWGSEDAIEETEGIPAVWACEFLSSSGYSESCSTKKDIRIHRIDWGVGCHVEFNKRAWINFLIEQLN